MDKGIERYCEKGKAPAEPGDWRLMSGMDRHTANDQLEDAAVQDGAAAESAAAEAAGEQPSGAAVAGDAAAAVDAAVTGRLDSAAVEGVAGAAAAVAEHAKTAEEYRQTADEHVKTLKDFWKDFLVSGIFILAAIVIIFACLAWFAANNRVNATGSSISAKGPRYTLESYVATGETGSVGAYESDIEPAPDQEETSTDEKGATSAGTSLLVTPSSNLNNTSNKGTLYPGARGQISFTVRPLVTDLKKVEVDISRVIKTAKGVDGTQLLNLLSGHLLYFKNCDNGYYSNRITGSKVEIDRSNFCVGDSTDTTQPVTVTIYWAWPEYIQNFILTGNANYYKNLFAEVGVKDSPYLTMQTDVNGAKSNFYYGTASETITADNAPALSPSMSSNDIATCSNLYNNADEYIGNNVKFLQLKLNSREVS